MISLALCLAVSLLAGSDEKSTARQLIEAGQAAWKSGDREKAVKRFNAAAAAAPRDPEPWMLLAEAYANQQKQDAALQAARRAEELGGDNPAVLQRLANFYGGVVPDLPKAADLGWRYAENASSDATAWRRVAALYLALDRPDKATAAALRGLPRDDSPDLHRLLAQAYAKQKDWTDAAREFAAVLKGNPYSEQAYFELAQTYLLAQDFPSAIRTLEDARKVFDKSPQIELALGVAYYGLRRFPEAVDQFLMTIALAPEVPQPYIFLGRILEHAADRLPEVTERFAQFEQRNPESSLGYVLHAKALLAGNADSSQIQQLVDKALSLKEDDADAHFLAGVLASRRGEYEIAAKHLERSIALNGNEAPPHYYLARAYDRLGRPGDAAREREQHQLISERDKATIAGTAPSTVPSVAGSKTSR
jgi:tetratricopeptide (TPR) repeat protein